MSDEPQGKPQRRALEIPMIVKRNRPRRSPASNDGDGGEKQARLAVNLPARLHWRLKARAAQQGYSIREYILDMLRKNGIR
jgi:hypothetical protein